MFESKLGFSVVSDHEVVFLGLGFDEANDVALIERAMGSKVMVRRTTTDDIQANNKACQLAGTLWNNIEWTTPPTDSTRMLYAF